MCLYSKQTKPIILRKDKVVWKIVMPYGKIFRSPYRRCVWKVGKMKSIKSFTKISYFGSILIYRGLHAFVYKYRANKQIKEMRSYFMGSLLVVKCIIPAGSRVWYGMNGDIASDKLIITEA